ncbi:hypothetical protein A2U01_0051926, partial [Trifolium medium]|nr:hypothetical protein [Trifolium medium]
VHGSLRLWELWRSAAMGMEEEYSPKRGMGTGMGNIMVGQGMVKYPPLNLRPVDIPKHS